MGPRIRGDDGFHLPTEPARTSLGERSKSLCDFG